MIVEIGNMEISFVIWKLITWEWKQTKNYGNAIEWETIKMGMEMLSRDENSRT